MKKILFATEFSDHAPEVFRYAIELAYFFKARLVVMHAFNQPEIKFLTKEETLKMADDTSNLLIDFVSKNLPEDYEDIKIDYVAQSGLAADAILEVAADEDVEMIVMGKTGNTNLLDAIFSQTTLEVMKKAACPVLAIPATAKFEGIDNIVFLTNFEFYDLAGIEYLKQWRKRFEAELHCLNVVADKDDLWASVQSMNILNKVYENRKKITYAVKSGLYKTEVLKFSKNKKADIIAITFKPQTIPERLTRHNNLRGAALDLNIPVLVIKNIAFNFINVALEGKGAN